MKKKLSCLFILIFVSFVSINSVFSADIGRNTTDTNKYNSTDGVVNYSSSVTSNNNFTVTVSHSKVEHGKPIIFTTTVKDYNGVAVANRPFTLVFYGMGDKSTPREGLFVTKITDSNGVFSETYGDNSGWFDYYELIISDGVENYSPTGNIYYRETFDLTLKPTISLDISKSTIYEGEYTQVKASVRVNGNPAVGYLLWHYGNGKSVTTILTNGISVFNYNSNILGNNPITVVYIGLGSGISGYVVSSVNRTFNIYVKGAPDLVVSKIVRSGNKYKVTVKNIGNGVSTKTKLKLWYSSKKYKLVNVVTLGAGKSKTYTVNFFRYSAHKKYKKYVQINYNKDSYDNNYTNNKLGFKSDVAYGLAANLSITKITRSGNNYIVTIKNKGNVNASAFRLKMWYGTKTKTNGLVTYTIKEFGQYGNKLAPGVSIALTIPYYKYSTHSKKYKFVSINDNKKVIESNYSNNIKKFKI